MSTKNYWLLKAEPDTRIVKGKDVRFSVDDFERVKTSPWEGVRNYEARNLMKLMKEGDQALFYHSNCKLPGVAAFAQVSKEAYPDYTAWDTSHPYYDAKSDSTNPKWFMVDLTFASRATHFVPLALLKKIADLPSSQLPEEISYIGEDGVKAIKSMDLVTRGRLSVQRVESDAWNAIKALAEEGGWDEALLKPTKKGKEKKSAVDRPSAKSKPADRKGKPKKAISESEGDSDQEPSSTSDGKISTAKRKRVVEKEDAGGREGLRRSTRAKK